MVTITAKLDDDTARALEEISGEGSKSEVIRTAIRKYVAQWKLEQRRKQVQACMQTAGVAEEMSRLAELDMDHAAELLERAENK